MSKLTPSMLVVMLAFLLSIAPCFAQAPACAVDKTKMARALGAPALAGILSIEAATCDALLLHEDEVGFRLSENSLPVYGGIRSEVALDFPFVEGDTIRYSWEMSIPVGFRGDAPLNRWWLVAQWHDQPDRRIGQTWAELPPRSPPISIYLEERSEGLGIGLNTNDLGKRSWTKLPLGKWLPMSVTIHWSRQGDGEVVLDVIGHPDFSVRVSGANMYNGYQHYLKFGQYRHPKITTNGSVFFRNLRITKM